MAHPIVLCKADLPIGEVRQIELPNYDDLLALFNVNGCYFLIQDTCTHGQASLSQGEIHDGIVYCPLHGGAFRIADGQPYEEPCTKPLKTYRVWLEGDDVVSDLEPR